MFSMKQLLGMGAIATVAGLGLSSQALAVTSTITTTGGDTADVTNSNPFTGVSIDNWVATGAGRVNQGSTSYSVLVNGQTPIFTTATAAPAIIDDLVAYVYSNNSYYISFLFEIGDGVLATSIDAEVFDESILDFQITEISSLALNGLAGDDSIVTDVDGFSQNDAFWTFDQSTNKVDSAGVGGPDSVTAAGNQVTSIFSFTLNGNNASIVDDSASVSINKSIGAQVTGVIPEPATTALSLMALAGLAGVVSSRRQKARA